MNHTYQYKQEYHLFQSQLKPSLIMNYLLAVPSDMEEGEKLPMLIFLHGAGERGMDTDLISFNGVPKYLNAGLPVRALVLCPQVPNEKLVWNNIAEETFELIQEIAAEYQVDHKKISLTGISMGGYGTWELGMMHPEFFSALGPICGGGMSWKSGGLINMPIRTCHGDADPVVPISASYEMVNTINANGGNVQMTILHGVQHDSWTFAYENTDLMEWLVAQSK